MKPKKTMKVLGIKDANGNPINPGDIGKTKRYIALHYQPKVLVENASLLLADLQKDNAPIEMQNLFTDIVTLLKWAEEKLPLAPPPTK